MHVRVHILYMFVGVTMIDDRNGFEPDSHCKQKTHIYENQEYTSYIISEAHTIYSVLSHRAHVL